MRALAEAHGGPFGLFEIRRLGISGEVARKRVQRGRWFRIHPAVYSLVPRPLLTPQGHRAAAVLACGPDAFLCCRAAAAQRGVRPDNRTRIDVGVPRRSAAHRPGIHIHRLSDIHPDEIELTAGIPCTTLARTMLDLAAVLPVRPVERALNEAEVQGIFDLRALEEQLDRHRGHRGAATLRDALDKIAGGSTVTFSWFEEQMMQVVDAAGLPRPRVNRYIDPGDGGLPVRADFHWPRHRLVVETDGWQFHRTRAAFESNRRGDQRLALLDIRVLRFTDRQFEHERPRVTRTLSALLPAVASPPAAAAG